MKTIFFNITLFINLVLISTNCFAYNKALPPFTNEEIKLYAHDLLKQNMPKRAKAYFSELKKRGDNLNAEWGIALTNIQEQNNKEAFEQIDSISKKYKDIQIKKLNSIKAELIIALSEEYLEKGNIPKARDYLREYSYYSNSYRKNNILDQRANYIHERINNIKDRNFKINIGVILPLTGKLSSIGKEIQKSLILTMYNNNFNNINLYFEDNQSSQEGSMTAATKVLNNSPAFIIGPILRDNVLAANTIISNTQIPIFALSNDESIAGRNIFINNVNLGQEAAEIAKFALDDQRLVLACLTPDNKYGKTQKTEFTRTVNSNDGKIRNCVDFDSKRIDIKTSLRKLLNIDSYEKKRKAELKVLEREYKELGNAMSDEKIKKMNELKEQKDLYHVDFNGIFIPTSPNKLVMIAPQLAFYDVDFSNNVLFLGNSSWDTENILRNNGEHLHFSRFLSLKSDKFKRFEKDFNKRYNTKPKILSGLAGDMLYISQQMNPRQNIYSQIYRPQGFSVITGNVKFNNRNMPERVYGVNKISRRRIKTVKKVKHQRPIELPSNLEIERKSVFNNWFGFN